MDTINTDIGEVKVPEISTETRNSYIKAALKDYNNNLSDSEAYDIGSKVNKAFEDISKLNIWLSMLQEHIDEEIENVTEWNCTLNRFDEFKETEIFRKIEEFCSSHDDNLLCEIQSMLNEDNQWGIDIYTEERLSAIKQEAHKNHRELCYGFVGKAHFAVSELDRYYLFDNFDFYSDYQNVINAAIEHKTALIHYLKINVDVIKNIDDISALNQILHEIANEYYQKHQYDYDY